MTEPPRREEPRQPLGGTLSMVLAITVASVVVMGLVGALGLTSLGEEGDATEFLLALAALSGPLLLVAGGLAWLTVEDLTGDMQHLLEGVSGLLQDEGVGEPVPVRSLDELGELSHRFEALRQHFADILERERAARRRLLEADKDKGEFLMAASHELRTPLNAILGFSDVLLSEIDGPLNEAQREDVGIVRDAGQHLASLFNDVLDLAAAASGELTLSMRPVAIEAVLGAVAQELLGQRGGRPIEIRVEAPDGLPRVSGDPKRIRQVVTNLAQNALKFTERGTIVLRATPLRHELRVDVADTGVGMSPRSLIGVFDEYEQAPESRRRGGAGLGLAIAKQLVALHGGRIEVESQRGVGSTFSIWLPVAREP